ncbi:MAG: LbtU family siderophore porin [Proteobacteria bacterium]|nr:LbtU family siderophore porin [Pseudomonadota bacterium]MBU2467664.1 LbtU family siderophore porin [Pseudomonadota bacterium]
MNALPPMILLLFFGLFLAVPTLAFSASDASEALLNELRALKTRVTELEQRLEKAQVDATKAQEAAMEARATSGRSLKVSQELSRTRDELPKGLFSEAGKRLKLYGAVELEANWDRRTREGRPGVESSDITLSTAELFVEAAINKYVTGVLHFLWEEGKTEPVDIDEAFILLGQTEYMPWYLLGGRIYPAVGLFESNFISDPITKELFETQESAVEIGYSAGWVNVGVGAFNSQVHQGNDDPESMINTFYGRAQFSTPEGLIPDGNIAAGVAYINNIASSGFLREQVPDDQLSELVGGLSLMASASWKMLALQAEYITALDEFKEGELAYAGAHKAKPWAFNLELAVMPWDKWTFAAKYGKAGDVFEEFPETRWGAVAAWEMLPNTVLSLEYLRGAYATGDTSDTVTSQLAIAF